MVYMLNENGEFVKTKNIPTLYANIMSYNIDDERFEKNPLLDLLGKKKLTNLTTAVYLLGMSYTQI